jgi:hypothetical protein
VLSEERAEVGRCGVVRSGGDALRVRGEEARQILARLAGERLPHFRICSDIVGHKLVPRSFCANLVSDLRPNRRSEKETSGHVEQWHARGHALPLRR